LKCHTDKCRLDKDDFRSIICTVMHIYRVAYTMIGDERELISECSSVVSYPLPSSSTADPGRTAEGRSVCVPPPGCVEAASSLRLSTTPRSARGRLGDGPKGRRARLLSAGRSAGGTTARGDPGGTGRTGLHRGMFMSPLSRASRRVISDQDNLRRRL
jgi:hypothetical protein